MKYCTIILCLGMSILSVVTSGFAGNQDELALETITVTAQKQEENIQDVPASVSVFDDLQIEDARIFSLKDIHNYVPNFETYPSYSAGGYQSIRGQSNFLTPSVGIYIDDVPITNGYTGVQTTLFDIERIEVLRGPQGNLYGMNSAGGIVNIITQKPGNTFKASGSTEYGNYNTTGYKAAVSGPVVEDKLFLGVAGSYRQRDSYIEEDDAETHKEKIMAGRFQLRWTPSDDTELIFTKSYENYDCDFDPWVVPAYGTFKIKNRGIEEGDDITDQIHSLGIVHRTPWFEITSISAHLSNEKYTIASKDFTSGGDNLKYRFMELDNKNWMQEIRLSSINKKSRFQWLLGGFYLNGVQDTYYNMRRNTGVQGAPTSSYTDDITTSEIETNTFSLFGQADYTFIDRLTLTLGLRYDYDQRKTDFYHNNKGVVQADYEDSTSWGSYSPKLALNYRASDSIMSYVSLARGYKPGGYHYVLGDTADISKYDPEYAWSYEAGIKTNWLNNKVIANICGFYSSVEDIQIGYVDPVTYEFAYRNAAEAVLWGLELEATVRPMSGLRIIGSLGLLESEFKKHKETQYEGNTIPFAPKFNASLAVQHNFRNGLYARAEGIWHGKTYFDEDNVYSQDNYLITNAKVGYENDNFNINIYVNNLFDETYYTIFNRASGVEKGVTGAPLTWGIQASLLF